MALVEPWIAFHAGEFERAVKFGLAAGMDGYAVATKATAIHANHVENSEKKKLSMFQKTL